MTRQWKVRFHLRTLVICLTIFAICLGVQVHRVHQRQQLIGDLRAMGGHVTTTARGPRWLVQLPLVRHLWMFNPVIEVHFLGPSLGDEDLKRLVVILRRLPRLQLVTMVETAVTHKGEISLKRQLSGVEVRRFLPVLDVLRSLPDARRAGPNQAER